MRLVETTALLPRPQASPPHAARAYGAAREPMTDIVGVIVPPRARQFIALPFLAQTLAQETIEEEGTPATRWRARDDAYRAGAATLPASRIDIAI